MCGTRRCCCATGRARNYTGGNTILRDWLRRNVARHESCRAAFRNCSGQAGASGWGIGYAGVGRAGAEAARLHLHAGYSRRRCKVALIKGLGTLLRLARSSVPADRGVPEEILYDRMKTVWLGTDEPGEIVWHPVFLDFARYWGFTPRVVPAVSAQTKGKWKRA